MRYGIATTITVPGRAGRLGGRLYAAWRAAYAAGRRSSSSCPRGETPDTAHVVGTNRIDISAVHDPRTGNFVITSAMDNLVKGASGQAVQIMNLWSGMARDRRAGLSRRSPDRRPPRADSGKILVSLGPFPSTHPTPRSP